MQLSRIWTLCRRAVTAWQEDRGPSRGAAIAFYTLFSISPVLVIMTVIAGYFLGQEAVQAAIIE